MSETNNYTITLKTNEGGKVLIFENWKYDSKIDEFTFDISVNSFGFAAKQMFSLYRFSFEKFLQALKKMATRLSGTVELKDEYEKQYVRMEIDHLGHVSVTGEFWLFNIIEQHLKFGFETDQTCLQPLFNELSQVLDDLHTTR